MKIAVIGVGNILFKDEGFGVFVSKYLIENYRFDDSISIIDGGTGGFKLVEYFQEFDYVIVVDIISVEDTAGSVYRLDGDTVGYTGKSHPTAHEVGLTQIMNIAKLSGKIAKTVIIGVVPKDIQTAQIGLTEELENVFNFVVEKILKELDGFGVSYEKINDKTVRQIVIDFIGSYNE